MDCFKATLFDDYAETMSSVKVSIPVSVTSAEAHHSNFNNLVFFILCVQLSLLSFFVLDEADRMVEKGHFQELQSIIDMLPSTNRKLHSHSLVQASTAPNGKLPRHESESDDREAPTHREEGVEEMPVDGVQFGSDIHEPQNETLKKKKRQTLVFSATLALPPGFKKKLKRGFLGDNGVSKKNEYSVASLSERAGVSHQAAIIDLTTRTVVAKKLEESVIE
jgi:ATP-dependent RNA helicase DDX24/MAK5